MKKIDLYQCEICGTQFKSKEDCVKCEKGHQKELHIVKTRYLPYTQDGSGMPTTGQDVGACVRKRRGDGLRSTRFGKLPENTSGIIIYS